MTTRTFDLDAPLGEERERRLLGVINSVIRFNAIWIRPDDPGDEPPPPGWAFTQRLWNPVMLDGIPIDPYRVSPVEAALFFFPGNKKPAPFSRRDPPRGADFIFDKVTWEAGLKTRTSASPRDYVVYFREETGTGTVITDLAPIVNRYARYLVRDRNRLLDLCGFDPRMKYDRAFHLRCDRKKAFALIERDDSLPFTEPDIEEALARMGASPVGARERYRAGGNDAGG